jgi:hypothetical protein
VFFNEKGTLKPGKAYYGEVSVFGTSYIAGCEPINNARLQEVAAADRPRSG